MKLMLQLHQVPRPTRGFTLIEVMIVVAIISILAAIAYPSYQNSVIKANRKDAMGVVQAAAQAAERFAVQNNTYIGATIPTKSPIDGTNNAVYTIEIAATATTYTITAKPVAGKVNDGLNITLNETGARGWGTKTTWQE